MRLTYLLLAFFLLSASSSGTETESPEMLFGDAASIQQSNFTVRSITRI